MSSARRAGDFPPRPECAPQWRGRLLKHLPDLQLALVIGQYALACHGPCQRATVTRAVAAWCHEWPCRVPPPQPRPRNALWLRRNPWFEAEVLPLFRRRVAKLLNRQQGGARQPMSLLLRGALRAGCCIAFARCEGRLPEWQIAACSGALWRPQVCRSQ